MLCEYRRKALAASYFRNTIHFLPLKSGIIVQFKGCFETPSFFSSVFQWGQEKETQSEGVLMRTVFEGQTGDTFGQTLLRQQGKLLSERHNLFLSSRSWSRPFSSFCGWNQLQTRHLFLVSSCLYSVSTMKLLCFASDDNLVFEALCSD